jgi:hypothetical protein
MPDSIAVNAAMIELYGRTTFPLTPSHPDYQVSNNLVATARHAFFIRENGRCLAVWLSSTPGHAGCTSSRSVACICARVLTAPSQFSRPRRFAITALAGWGYDLGYSVQVGRLSYYPSGALRSHTAYVINVRHLPTAKAPERAVEKVIK